MKIFCKNRTFIFVLVLLFAAKSMFAMKEEQKINEKFNPEVAMQLISWEDPLYWKRLVITKQTEQEIVTLIRDNRDTIKGLKVMFQAFFSYSSFQTFSSTFPSFKTFFHNPLKQRKFNCLLLNKFYVKDQYLETIRFYPYIVGVFDEHIKDTNNETKNRQFLNTADFSGAQAPLLEEKKEFDLFEKNIPKMFEYYKIDEKDRHFFFSFLFVAALKSAPMEIVNKIPSENYRSSTLLFQYYFENYLHDFVRTNDDKENTEEKKQIYLKKIKQYKQQIENDPELPREQNVLHMYIDSALFHVKNVSLKDAINVANLRALEGVLFELQKSTSSSEQDISLQEKIIPTKKDITKEKILKKTDVLQSKEISSTPWYKDYAKILKIIAGGLFLGSPLIWFLYKKYKR